MNDEFRIVNYNSKKLANSTSIVSPPKHNYISQNPYSALADTAASHNYLDERAIPYCNTPVPAVGPQVRVANGNIITPIAQAELNVTKELSAHVQYA